MDTLIITLPTEVKNFMNEQIAKGNYANASDCFAQLLVQDKARQESGQLVSE
jgi:Arc/MetJ-type ribon-helix-helix transcriptional regulator